MTDREYVIRASQIKGLDLTLPTKECRGILAHQQFKSKRGIYECVIDASSWKEAREQVDKFFT